MADRCGSGSALAPLMGFARQTIRGPSSAMALGFFSPAAGSGEARLG